MSPFRGSAGLTGDWRHFALDHRDGVATLTFTRPDRLNALTFDVYADLRDVLHELPLRGDTRALVLRGEGRAFCSGGDVEEIIAELLGMRERPDQLLDFTRMTGDVVKAMRETPIPIVAAVHGIAAGAGSVLALAADFRIVARSARFAFLFTKVGLSGADMGAAYLLPRIVGVGHASRLLLLGDTIDAAQAERIGLVSELVDDDALDDAATATARRLADGPAFAYATTKSLISRELDMPLSAALELDATTQALLMGSADFREFHAAFTQQRQPNWRGR
ncbi:MAG: enoyl-CoA hydratase family protein [Mycobacteriales bacterium]|nr:MAG: enoyl-CoA hydratase family protein [Pseudonocardiales bacterium]